MKMTIYIYQKILLEIGVMHLYSFPAQETRPVSNYDSLLDKAGRTLASKDVFCVDLKHGLLSGLRDIRDFSVPPHSQEQLILIIYTTVTFFWLLPQC